MLSFDLQSLETLLADFYNLTNIKTCLYDAEGNELCYYPTKHNAFCEILREDEEMDKLCRSCDKHAFAICRKTRSQYAYICHAGLQECISPILYDNRIIGFIMIGQIKSKSDADFLNFEKTASDGAKERLRAAYGRLPNISNRKLLSAFHILDACAGYEHLKTLLKTYKNSIDAQIDEYIHKNISNALSVSDLCLKFHLSRYEIYNICNEYFCCTPAEYIKKCRLIYAAKMLTETDIPINKIAVLCGIPDYNYFSKVFKSVYGISPTEYKKSGGK